MRLLGQLLAYAACVVLTPTVILLACGLDESSMFFSLASSIIGHSPQPGDGAFHIPLGWLLMIATGLVIGVLEAVALFFVFRR